MLVRTIFNKQNFIYRNLTSTFTFSISQTTRDLFQSKYHQNGPYSIKKNRAIQKLLANNLKNIQKLQKQIQTVRKSLIQSKVYQKTLKNPQQIEGDVSIMKYTQLYESLIKVISGCQINNQWIYNFISWYNMITFYDILLQRTSDADHVEIVYLADALYNMKYSNKSIPQAYKNKFKYFYKNQTNNHELSILRKIQAITSKQPLNFYKRKYFQKYFNIHLQSILKTLDTNNPQSVSNLIWLFETSITCMNDEQINIIKFQRYLLTNHLKLSIQDGERLINAYNKKGSININIYQVYIKPFIIMNKMNNINNIVQSIKFIIYSSANDLILLAQLFQKLQKVTVEDINKDNLRNLNILLHYLHINKIKNVKIKINKVLENKLKNYCSQNYQYGNYINSLDFFKEKQIRKEIKEKKDKQYKKQTVKQQKQLKEKQNKSLIPCLMAKEAKALIPLTPEQIAAFIPYYEKSINLLSLSQYYVYHKVKFSCFQLQYLLIQKNTNVMINMETQHIDYIFNSGKLSRQVQIRDSILMSYNIKADHLFAFRYKNKGINSDDDLMNKKVHTSKKKE